MESRGQEEVTQETVEISEAQRDAAQGEPSGKPREVRFFTFRRLWPLIVIALGIFCFFALGLESYVTFESLKQNREWLLRQVAENSVLTMVGFVVVYAAIAGFSLPGATVASITGGFLFGLWLGALLNVIAATIGATLLFLAARSVFFDVLHQKAGPWLRKVEAEFNDNAFSYLLFLRLVPLFPFFAVNLIPAFLGVRLVTFVVTTFFGIIPGAIIYTSVGAGLGAIFDQGSDSVTVRAVVTPEFILGMAGLAVLSLLPIAYKKLWGRKPGA